MKNVRTLCASLVLVIYALLAGASIDENGNFEWWFIAICIIIPIILLVIFVVDILQTNEQKNKAISKIPNTYTLDKQGVDCAFYIDSQNNPCGFLQCF